MRLRSARICKKRIVVSAHTIWEIKCLLKEKLLARSPVYHLLQRHSVPGDGQGRGAGSGTAGTHGGVSCRANLLRADALEHGIPGGGSPGGGAFWGALSLREEWGT